MLIKCCKKGIDKGDHLSPVFMVHLPCIIDCIPVPVVVHKDALSCDLFFPWLTIYVVSSYH